MKKKWKKWLLLFVLPVAAFGVLCLWGEVNMAVYQEQERVEKLLKLAKKAEEQAALCRKWAEAAQRCSSIRLRILYCGERYWSPSPAEQERIRSILIHRALPLPILDGYWEGFAFADWVCWNDLQLLDESQKVILSIDEYELQSYSSLREYGKCNYVDKHLNAIISEEDKVFLTELFKKAEKELQLPWDYYDEPNGK